MAHRLQSCENHWLQEAMILLFTPGMKGSFFITVLLLLRRDGDGCSILWFLLRMISLSVTGSIRLKQASSLSTLPPKGFPTILTLATFWKEPTMLLVRRL